MMSQAMIYNGKVATSANPEALAALQQEQQEFHARYFVAESISRQLVRYLRSLPSGVRLKALCLSPEQCRELIEEAQEKGMEFPETIPPLNNEQFARWWKRFGFRFRGIPVEMAGAAA